jgi:hypothetical protein
MVCSVQYTVLSIEAITLKEKRRGERNVIVGFIARQMRSLGEHRWADIHYILSWLRWADIC